MVDCILHNDTHQPPGNLDRLAPHGFILSECSLKPSGVILLSCLPFHSTMDSDEIVEPLKEEDLDAK